MTAKAKENGMSRDATIWQSPEVPECVSTIPEGISSCRRSTGGDAPAFADRAFVERFLGLGYGDGVLTAAPHEQWPKQY